MVTNYNITSLNDDYSISVYWSIITIFHKYINIAIIAHQIIISYYAVIMHNDFNDPLHSKLFWHNR